ncbi:probable sulfate transporter [Alloactinosynnema sp. L-07]|uniref:SulP family inorganic anion transporter n=1 Tax=Alloactinosynnema sp. L-07 TaxID=1653480 RepID=UPI00065EF544|nr:SulP family inorganic anion transporter [Alloactinosynnema sp. L-07]CRK59656.1 probable sulfate transporter [Alloactinosynnema sp. L-07]
MTVAARPKSGGNRYLADARSGFLVSLIALPLSLGIAVASGFPPIAGVMTAIIGGVVVSLFGSARLTIKGPAAGLIVIAIGAVTELGQGDMVAGYRRALAVGVVAAALQIVFAFARVATVGLILSPSVVHGMLAAIGVLIIAKQVHVLAGVTPVSQHPLGLLAEIPHSLLRADGKALLIGLIGVVIMVAIPMLRRVRSVPAPLLVVAVAIPLGLLLNVEPSRLVQLPGSLLDAVAFPDFSHILSATSIQYIVMFALIGSIESTLTVIAVDGMDPARRASDLNRDLLALGAGNLVSSMVGGLPMISEIVRSKANVDAGATSRWSNFAHGAFLLLLVVLIPGVLQTIPLAALAAMLVYTGARLAAPREFRRAAETGRDQVAIFVTTLVVTLLTDLLIGVAAGLALKLLLHLVRGVPVSAIMRPRVDALRSGPVLRLKVHGAAVFPALLPIRRAVARAEDEVTDVVVDVGDTRLVDHTFLSRLDAMAAEWPNVSLTVEGRDTLVPVANHPHAVRRRRS